MDSPGNLLRAAKFNKVPLLLGANQDGGSIFEPFIGITAPNVSWPVKKGDDGLRQVLSWFMPAAEMDQAVSIWSEEEFQSSAHPGDARLSRILRDLIFQCSNRRVAQAWASHSPGTKAFLYTFSFNMGLVQKPLGDFHASELPLEWKNWLPVYKTITKEVDRMSDIMTCKWAFFVYCQDPNGCPQGQSPAGCDDFAAGTKGSRISYWPYFDSTQREYYSLNSEPSVGTLRADNKYPDDEFPRDEKCDFIDRVDLTLPWRDIKDSFRG